MAQHDQQQPLTHRPGPDGVLGSQAACGATPTNTTGILRQHEYDYDCTVCRGLSGERS